ncbi:MAG: hypothetical protein IJW49_06535 [Clostridia bacterium]|nr:hypothetical protein [Clostridia bacterium]
MKRKKLLVAGIAAVFAVASIFMVAAKRKPKQNRLFAGLIFSAIAGFLGAVAFVYHRRHKKREKLKIEELIDSFDADRLDEHISEVLGRVSHKLLEE